jgi:YD repeat-containing protein
MVSSGATTGYNVNNLDQYTSVGGSAYGYDADGNLTSGGGWSYTYDDEDRLIAASGPTGSWSYQYDALGDRVAQTNGATTTQYLVDPTGMGSVVAEFGGGGNVVSHFAYGLGLTSSLPASGSAQFYQFDGSANTVAVTGTGGAVLNSYSYLPFGEKVSTGSVPNPFTYAGQLGITDDGDGLYYMRARYYDPTHRKVHQ